MTPPIYKTTDPRYWDEADLLADKRRQYDVCHGCRLCWNLCPMFPSLFDLTDAVEGEMEQVGSDAFSAVEDLCYQCKLCWVVCPYTAPHEYDMDVPRMIARSKFVEAEREGIGRAKKVIGDQDRLAKLAGGPLAPITNMANKFPPARRISELVLGIHHDAKLPEYHLGTFSGWFKKHYGEAMRPSEQPIRKVAFFPSCTIDYNDQHIGRSAIAVLEHNNVEVVVPDHQCCGMPLMDIGEYKGAVGKMEHNLHSLSKLVADGYDIVVPQPTCSLVIREDYPRMTKEAEMASNVALHTFELGTYLTKMAQAKVLMRDFKAELGKIAFHVACHTRAQAVGINSPRLLGIVPGTTVETTESCSGHDGSWGVSKQYFAMSLRVGNKLFTNLQKDGPDLIISDCPLAARHIEIGTGQKPIHTVEALAMAYDLPRT